MINAETLKRLAALQLTPEAMQEVLSIIASCIEPIEDRRRRERDRQRKRRGNVTLKSRDSPDVMSRDNVCDIPPLHISTPPIQKPKRVSVSIDASEIPERLTEEAKGYALSKGWDSGKADCEWQRFRDHGISKGRLHRGERGMHAAWRNWVTSPFQTNGNSNGSGSKPEIDRSAVAGADRVLERMHELTGTGRAGN